MTVIHASIFKNPKTTYYVISFKVYYRLHPIRINLHFCDGGRKWVYSEVVKCVSFYHTGKENQKYTISMSNQHLNLPTEKSLSWYHDDHIKSFFKFSHVNYHL